MTILLTPGAASLPDNTADNLTPAMQAVKSSASAPGVYFLQLAFDASSEEWCCWSFRMPDDYVSGLTAKVLYKMASATSGGVAWDVRVAAVSDGDSTDVDAKGFGTANVGTATVPGTAGYLDEVAVTLTNDDAVASGDFVVIRLARATADASDTATGDAECVSLTLTYSA